MYIMQQKKIIKKGSNKAIIQKIFVKEKSRQKSKYEPDMSQKLISTHKAKRNWIKYFEIDQNFWFS